MVAHPRRLHGIGRSDMSQLCINTVAVHGTFQPVGILFQIGSLQYYWDSFLAFRDGNSYPKVNFAAAASMQTKDSRGSAVVLKQDELLQKTVHLQHMKLQWVL